MKHVLRFLSLFYQAGCQIKNALYRIKLLHPKKAPLTVLSVGNITFGGSEKTPLVATLVAALLQNGFKLAVVTRGYKGRWERSGGVLSDGKSRSGTWIDSGDEPFMLSIMYPEIGVFVGRDRFQSCSKAHNMGFEIVILDDGFQHRRLYRDIDIVLHDPLANLPQREPRSSIKRTDILLVKKGSDTQTAQGHLFELKGVDTFFYSVSHEGFYSLDRLEEPPSSFKEKRVLAFCGIARPERFQSLLEQAGIKPIYFHTFPDHFPYPDESIKKIKNLFHAHNADVCVVTEKDAVKIKENSSLQDIPTYFLKIGLQTDEALYETIISIIEGKGASNV
jgi:tetraacyldisaccharide 4'-kinase